MLFRDFNLNRIRNLARCYSEHNVRFFRSPWIADYFVQGSYCTNIHSGGELILGWLRQSRQQMRSIHYNIDSMYQTGTSIVSSSGPRTIFHGTLAARANSCFCRIPDSDDYRRIFRTHLWSKTNFCSITEQKVSELLAESLDCD